MSLWWRFLLSLIALIFLVTIQVGLAYLLPYPFSKLNVIFCALIIWLLWSNSGSVVWLAFFAHFLLELYNASPFGVVLAASVFSFLISFWLYHTVFTNRSWYAAAALTFFTVSFFRFLYIIILAVLFLLGRIEFVPWRLIFITWFWEMLFTGLAVLCVYFVLARFSRRLRAAIIEGSIYGRN